MTEESGLKRYRLIVETDADAFQDVDDLLITIEIALDAERMHGETAAVWFESDIGPSVSSVTSEG